MRFEFVSYIAFLYDSQQTNDIYGFTQLILYCLLCIIFYYLHNTMSSKATYWDFSVQTKNIRLPPAVCVFCRTQFKDTTVVAK